MNVSEFGLLNLTYIFFFKFCNRVFFIPAVDLLGLAPAPANLIDFRPAEVDIPIDKMNIKDEKPKTKSKANKN